MQRRTPLLKMLRVLPAPIRRRKAPKKFTPVERNPLSKWSDGIGWPQHGENAPVPLFDAVVGMEGCTTAFNAVNTIRTAKYFGTQQPPHFLSVAHAGEIEALQVRKFDDAEGQTKTTHDQTSMICGNQSFDALHHIPLIALENFFPGATSICSTRIGAPHTARRILIGHENYGVDPKYCARPFGDTHAAGLCVDEPTATKIVYIPQYGTISSLNVVTCLGISLFCSFLDATAPHCRTLVDRESNDVCVPAVVAEYQRVYATTLPKVGFDGKSSDEVAHQVASPPACHRVDSRPIHPMFYHKDKVGIVSSHLGLVETLASLEGRHAGTMRRSTVTNRPLFGISLFYENDMDQRNFGGLLRSANAFLVDHVFYIGKKKMNIVGAVGCQHYNRPIYLGGADEITCDSDADTLEQRIRSTLPVGTELEWMFLSCGHEWLYRSITGSITDPVDSGAIMDHISLTETEAHLLNVFGGEHACEGRHVVIVIPQEGTLPKAPILRRCKRALHIRGKDFDDNNSVRADEQELFHRGLPSQVATSIALFRLFSAMHPQLRW